MPEPNPLVLEQARRGDPIAIEQLIREQERYIYSVALSVARDPDDAADVMQEACVKLVKALPGYRAEARFTTWLYRLVVNAGLDLLRRRGRAVSLDDHPTEAARLPTRDRRDDPEASAQRADVSRRVRAALDRLPPGQRLALTLQFFEDLRYEEIAEIMDLPLNTLKSHLRRGKEALARDLADLAPRPVPVEG